MKTRSASRRSSANSVATQYVRKRLVLQFSCVRAIIKGKKTAIVNEEREIKKEESQGNHMKEMENECEPVLTMDSLSNICS